MRPKPNIPKNIVAKVTVNTNLSFSVILCSSFIIKGRSVARQYPPLWIYAARRRTGASSMLSFTVMWAVSLRLPIVPRPSPTLLHVDPSSGPSTPMLGCLIFPARPYSAHRRWWTCRVLPPGPLQRFDSSRITAITQVPTRDLEKFVCRWPQVWSSRANIRLSWWEQPGVALRSLMAARVFQGWISHVSILLRT